LRVVRGRPVARAARLRHAAAGHRADGAGAHRPRVQSRGRFAPGGRPRDSQDVRAEAEQRGAFRVLRCSGDMRERGAQVRRAKRVRCGAARHAVADVRQRPLRQRTVQPSRAIRRPRRRHTPETTREVAGGT